MASVTKDEIINAFISYKPELFVKEVMEYLLKQRKSFKGDYESKYTFNSTIQAIIQRHSPAYKRYDIKNEAIFEKIGYGKYRLYDDVIQAQAIKKDPDTFISALSVNSNENDLEETTRSIREVNTLNRRKDLVVGLKLLYNNICQICETPLKISENKFYSEVHHIKPLGQPHNGPDKTSNMLVVCPNCHVLLDLGVLKIEKEKIGFKKPHTVDDVYIRFHNGRNAFF